jgi:hypothetical protein
VVKQAELKQQILELVEQYSALQYAAKPFQAVSYRHPARYWVLQS